MSDGYTVKEMVSRVLDQNEEALVTQTKLLAHAENVDKHLAQLNSKVASHVVDIQQLQNKQSRTETIFYTLSSVLTVVWAGLTFLFK